MGGDVGKGQEHLYGQGHVCTEAAHPINTQKGDEMTHYWLSDAWPLVICLTLALLATDYLAWHNWREAIAYRRQRNLAIDDAKCAYERGKREAESSFRRADYEHGIEVGRRAAMIEALEAVSAQDAERQKTTRAD